MLIPEKDMIGAVQAVLLDLAVIREQTVPGSTPHRAATRARDTLVPMLSVLTLDAPSAVMAGHEPADAELRLEDARMRHEADA